MLQQPDRISKADWIGHDSHKFVGSRAHVKQNLKNNPYQQRGMIHFPEKLGIPFEFKPICKPYENKFKCTQQADHRNLKNYIQFQPTIQKSRSERVHLRQPLSEEHQMQNYGIKTFHLEKINNKQEIIIEKQMGNKIKVRDLATMRNGLSMRQLGDKNYKAVEYVPDFYKKSHVVPPVFGRVNKEEIIKQTIIGIKQELTWKFKEQNYAQQQDIESLKCIDDWEQAVLKEANPNWIDVDKVPLESLEPKVDPKGKDNKKPAKK